MTTKQLTKEMIFERLGWKKYIFSNGKDYCRQFPNGDDVTGLPDPLHDLNVTFKYVWPRFFRDGCIDMRFPPDRILYQAFLTDNPALAICQAFMDLPEEKK